MLTRPRSGTLLVLALLALPSRAWPAFTCYDTRAFPSVVALETFGDGFRAYLDPANGFVRSTRSGPPVDEVPTLVYSRSSGWRKDAPRSLPHRPVRADEACVEPIPDESIALSPDDAKRLRPELVEGVNFEGIGDFVSACVRENDTTWFGLGF